VLMATIVIIATKGRVGRAKAATATEFGPAVDRASVSAANPRTSRRPSTGWLRRRIRRVVSRTVTCSGGGCR